MRAKPAILHHKYSMEDGHVAPQIRKIRGYRGIFVIRSKGEKRNASPFTSYLTLKKIRKNPRLLKSLRVAAVHVHHGSLAPKFLFLKEKYGLPLFVGFRGNDATAFPKRSKENLASFRKLFTAADRFFPVCDYLKQQIVSLGCPEEKVRVLYGGVDLDRFTYKPRVFDEKKSIRFLAVGRFVEKKGFDDLIRAFAAVKERNPKVKLKLIGQGPCDAEYRKLIKRFRLNDSIEIVPWVDYRSIHRNYERSHIFCAPSCTDPTGNQEGIPNTLKEAMATGLPVVSTYHAGIPELVEHRSSGILVPEKSVAELADAMSWLAEHPEKWFEFGKRGREKIENRFHLKKQLKVQKDYYDEVLRRR